MSLNLIKRKHIFFLVFQKYPRNILFFQKIKILRNCAIFFAFVLFFLQRKTFLHLNLRMRVFYNCFALHTLFKDTLFFCYCGCDVIFWFLRMFYGFVCLFFFFI